MSVCICIFFWPKKYIETKLKLKQFQSMLNLLFKVPKYPKKYSRKAKLKEKKFMHKN